MTKKRVAIAVITMFLLCVCKEETQMNADVNPQSSTANSDLKNTPLYKEAIEYHKKKGDPRFANTQDMDSVTYLTVNKDFYDLDKDVLRYMVFYKNVTNFEISDIDLKSSDLSSISNINYPKLGDLAFSNTGIDDKQLKQIIIANPKLEILGIANEPNITDASFASFLLMKDPYKITLISTSMSDTKITELKKKLKNTIISTGEGHISTEQEK
ncbi:hypothetical protein [Leptospira stimsonii]|uniref:Leucine-rich repeat domain-containing protein n=1 Tax=Leptospira stimsonii TaxID=2202203 RepID=A0ABY2MWD8_9LEPT|nr:hypothetical protein [Leptospira stimsonii]TGK15729.1 hypothetical protein EHO98_14440 [Leptospira stimsonii]TGM10258.1 hypothetical protein EHQ90_19195 [Leptospira stimsonii]